MSMPTSIFTRNTKCIVELTIYLNPDRDDSYEGHLELWNRNITPCRQRMAPISGRFVAFTATDFSYHGHP